MPKLDLKSIPVQTSCAYPAPFDEICRGREKQKLGDAGDLTQFGVNLTKLNPGAASAHKHWHQNEDEMVYMLEGEAVLEEGDERSVLHAGDVAYFKAGVAIGHHLINESDQPCVFLEIGTRSMMDLATYTDPAVDLVAKKQDGHWQMQHRDGKAY